MNRRRYLLFFLLLFFTGFSLVNSIDLGRLKTHVEYLSSDQLGGRKAGSEGDSLAADYIRSQFYENKLKLLADNGYQYFEVVTEVLAGDKNSLIFENYQAKVDVDFRPYSFSANTSLTADVVFGGYGFQIKNDSFQWDDYQGIDVEGKWVLIFNGEPGIRMYSKYFSDHSELRSKVLKASDMKAAGLLVVNPPSSSKEDVLDDIYYERILVQASLPVFQITRKLADQILLSGKTSVEELEQKIKTQKTPISFHIPMQINGESDVIFVRKKTQNIIGMIEGSDPALKNEYIIIGAHYDHLGMGGKGSGSRMTDSMALHPGADDNASGVAGIIEMSRILNKERKKLKRSIIVVAFGAEEIGLLGSKYFADHPVVSLEKIKMMINYDMIGRLRRENMFLTVAGTGTFKDGDSFIFEIAAPYDFNLRFSESGYGASDHATFYSKDVPVLFISTGAHVDYHTPMDMAEKINYQGIQMVVDLSLDMIRKIANVPEPPVFIKVQTTEDATTRGYSVTMGVLPDFTSNDNKGMRVESVRSGAPAFHGGMMGGDVIVAIEGLEVRTIYDYMNRMKQLQKGQIITVDVIRNNERVVLIIQL